MNAKRSFPSLTVNKKAEAKLKTGHPWVYGEEITTDMTPLANGCLVDVLSQKGTYLGTGLYSRASKISVRILAANANESFGEAFFERRVRYAIEYRRTVMREDFSSCRLIFGEADGLPGLTVDKYESILVAQVLSYGIEMRKDMIFSAIVKILAEYGEKVDGIFERNDVAIRRLEGLDEYKGWYTGCGMTHPDSAVAEITENGIKYTVDVENGQKTGFFLDQKYNRRAVARIADGKNVLDCFTHTGSFALNAAAGNAAHVTALDISSAAVEMAKANAEKNGLSDKMSFICADTFDYLAELDKAGKSPYDLIILDPPAFTKSRKTVDNASRGYKEINLKAMKLLPRGGYFATASCSHFMKNDLFVKMLEDAAHDAGRQLKQIEARTQSPDHPILWNVPETDYLKFYIFQVI